MMLAEADAEADGGFEAGLDSAPIRDGARINRSALNEAPVAGATIDSKPSAMPLTMVSKQSVPSSKSPDLCPVSLISEEWMLARLIL